MEQTYWIGRKRAAAANARIARSAEARLAHLELAGRYSIRAAASAPAPRLALRRSEAAEAGGFGAVAAGAMWLERGPGGDGA
jgi:hypothetical protein